MRAGKLDRLIDIQRATTTLSTSGEPVLSWTNLDARRPASMERRRDPIELAGNVQIMASDQVEFRVHYSSDIDDLTPKDRIIYPALDITSPETAPAAIGIFNIIAVAEIGRREGLRIIAWRRTDVSEEEIIALFGAREAREVDGSFELRE